MWILFAPADRSDMRVVKIVIQPALPFVFTTVEMKTLLCSRTTVFSFFIFYPDSHDLLIPLLALNVNISDVI